MAGVRPKERPDGIYFAPLQQLHLGRQTELYLGLIHHNGADGDMARLAAAWRYATIVGDGLDG